jgi:hypothetical protein
MSKKKLSSKPGAQVRRTRWLRPSVKCATSWWERKKIEIALKDIPFQVQEFLDSIWQMMVTFKVPRKAKQYEQKFVRTMYFERLEEDFTIIDGKNYKV